MNLEVEYANEWEKVHAETPDISMVENSRVFANLCLGWSAVQSPAWTQEWISPIDAQFAASILASCESDETLLLVDEGDGSVAAGIAHYLSIYKPNSVFVVAADTLSHRSSKLLSSLESCIGIMPTREISTRKINYGGGVAGRFTLQFHALSAFSRVIELFLRCNALQCLVMHEVWNGHRYPFQYHASGNMPNLAHVLELLCKVGKFRKVTHSSCLNADVFSDFEKLNHDSANKNVLVGSYRWIQTDANSQRA